MADPNPKKRPDPETDIDDPRDPEFEIPDPEQVERDREEAERLYDEQRRKDPAA
jgi:hypothetical protein